MKVNIFLYAAIALLLAGSFSSCTEKGEAPDTNQILECDCKDELYYYSVLDDQKYYFDDRLLNDWLHVGFNLQVQDDEIVKFINETGLFKPVDIRNIIIVPEEYRIGVPTGINGSINYKRLYVNTKEQKTCSQLKEIICTLEESPMVAFANLAFWYWKDGSEKEKGMESFSNYFYVTVKDKDDLSDLYSVSQEMNTIIIEQPEYLSFSSTFTLQLNKSSKGNALQMGNYFAETGKFELAGPEWLDGFKPVLMTSMNKN